MLEMIVFLGLIVPLPSTWRRKLFTFISESPAIAKLQYGLKITFIFILILFIDSVNRVYRVQLEIASYGKDAVGGGRAAAALGAERMEVQARRFYSQRNMYLCGFTLFLSLILNRTYIMILEVLRLEDKVKLLRQQVAEGGDKDEVARLKKELEAKDRDMAVLKKQVEGLQREYHELGNKVAPEDGTPKKDR